MNTFTKWLNHIRLFKLKYFTFNIFVGEHKVPIKKKTAPDCTHSGYGTLSERSKREEAIEFSDNRLWESYRRISLGVEGSERRPFAATKVLCRYGAYSAWSSLVEPDDIGAVCVLETGTGELNVFSFWSTCTG